MFGGGSSLWSKGEKRQALGYQAFAQKRAELLNKQAGSALDKGFADALAQAQRGAERSRASILQMGQAGQGAAQASAMGRGLSGTTVQDNLARMARSDTANQLIVQISANIQAGQEVGVIAAHLHRRHHQRFGILVDFHPAAAQIVPGVLDTHTADHPHRTAVEAALNITGKDVL